MDRSTAVLCTIGAAAVALMIPAFGYHDTALIGVLAIAAGVVGVARATNTKAHALIAFFVLGWIVGGVWDALPEAFVDYDFLAAHKTVVATTNILSEALFTAGLIGLVIAARSKLGRGPTTLAVVLLALGFLLVVFALVSDAKPDSSAILLGVRDGVRAAALRVTAVCLLFVALAPEVAPAKPYSGLAAVAVVAATVLTIILLSEALERSLRQGATLFVVFELVWIAAAVGLSRLSRAAMVLCIVQVVALLGAAALFEKLSNDYMASALEAAMPLGFFAFAAAMAGGEDPALRGPRRVSALLSVITAVGAMIGFLATMVSLARIFRINNSFKPVWIIVRPAGSIALPLAACCIAWMIAPPAPAQEPLPRA